MLKSLLRSLAIRKDAESLPIPTGHVDVEALLRAPIEALKSGRLDEALSLLNQVLRNYHDLAPAHVLVGNVLHQRGELDDARDSYTLALAFEPNSWPAYFHLALLDLDQARCTDAVLNLVKAIDLGAEDARVHNALGATYLRNGNVDDAVLQFRRAVALQPDYADAYSNLGYVLFREMEAFEEGAGHIENAVKLAPDSAAALCNLTMVLQQRGQVEDALSLCNKLLLADPDLHEARANRALMLLMKGDFAPGWRDYEARKSAWASTFKDELRCPEWDGSDLTGKTIFIQAEQGIGDEIMFASCLHEVIARAGTCIVECSPKLEVLFRRSFTRAIIVKKNEWRESAAVRHRTIDWKVAIGSLPRLMRNTLAHFPLHQGYLHADPERVAYWSDRLHGLPKRKKVGISWRGGARSTRGSLRSIPLEAWLPILGLHDVDFISLQYSDCEQELNEVRQQGVRIEHWPDAIDDYAETAALVSALDLVVSVQTAVVHLAGALGKPAWALISAVPEWRYGCEGEKMPWYPSVRLVRQAALGEWEPVIAQVHSELGVWAGESS